METASCTGGSDAESGAPACASPADACDGNACDRNGTPPDLTTGIYFVIIKTGTHKYCNGYSSL